MSHPLSSDVLIFGAKRTPFGTFGGALKGLSATELAIHAAEAALAQAGGPKGALKAAIDHVVFGNVAQTSADAIYLARHVGLRCGLPVAVPALTVNRLCGSGFEALVQAALLLGAGEAELVLAGGTESMSQAPHVLRGARDGLALGKTPALEDSLWAALTDSYTGLPMGMTAENLGTKFGITQAEVDEFSLLSQRRFAAAQEAGRLDAELAPLELADRKGTRRVARDEHNRPETTLESLARLPKVFKKDGLVHAGAASGIADGAGALVLGTRKAGEAHGLKPLGRLLQFATVGCDPELMGIGPVPAIEKLFAKTGLAQDTIDLFEINEAFAPQYLAVEKALRLDRAKTNVDGGAIAVGHPLAASGARLTMHLLYELKRRGARFGIAAACIGGGQGTAVLLESL